MNHGPAQMAEYTTRYRLPTVIGRGGFTFHLNWASVLFYSFFIAYGIYGAHTPANISLQSALAGTLPKSIFLAMLLATLGLTAWKSGEQFKDSVILRGVDALVFLGCSSVLVLLSYSQLRHALFSDELFYSYASHAHAIYLSSILANRLPILENIPFRYLVHGFSFMLLALASGFIFFSTKLSWKIRVILFPVLLIILRAVISMVGGNNSPHPPLNLVPIQISGAIFGITDFSLKLSSFIPYTIFVLVVQRIIVRVFDQTISVLMALVIATIPLLLLLGSTVEQSLWSAICFTLVLLELITAQTQKFMRLMSLIAIATLMRQPSFLAVVAVAISLLIFWIKSPKGPVSYKNFMMLIIPTIVFAPFLADSLIYGTPTTEAISNNSLTTALDNFLHAVQSGIIWISILNSVPFWMILIVPFAVMPLSQMAIPKNAAVGGCLVVVVFVFYSVDPGIWGSAKYQAELCLPFGIVGLLLVTLRLRNTGMPRSALLGSLVMLVILNIVNFLEIPRGNKPVDKLADTYNYDKQHLNSGYRLLLTFPYSMQEAFRAVKAAGLSEHSYSMGVTYGILPQILNGYTAKEVKTAKDIAMNQSGLMKVNGVSWTTGRVDLVESDSRIKVVLLGYVFPDKNGLIDQFKNNNWEIFGEFKDTRFGSTVVVLKRE